MLQNTINLQSLEDTQIGYISQKNTVGIITLWKNFRFLDFFILENFKIFGRKNRFFKNFLREFAFFWGWGVIKEDCCTEMFICR